MGPRVVDTFLFVDAYEADVLLVKLHLESPLVERFILVESDVTFRGDYKGLQARNLIETDERFASFRDRITIVEHRGRLFDGPPCYQTYYENEERSRASVWPHISDLPDDTWVMVSDVDEAVDCTDPSRLKKFCDILVGHCDVGATLYFGHYRYWYDFDNLCPWRDIFTPVAQLGTFRSGQTSFMCRSRESRNNRIFRPGDEPLFFEYTHCFPAEAIWKKLNSFIHDGYTRDELNDALLTNHWVKAASRGEYPGQRGYEDWFDTVPLTERNSPKYVRENLGRLKTFVIPEDYLERRQRRFGSVAQKSTETY